MSERFTAYFEQLERLSTEDLDRSAVEVVLAEKQNVAFVIAHIAEISRRKADLERAYPNLFVYCLQRLGLSEGSVGLRIHVANVARRFPQVLAALAEGRISLSVAGRLAPHLSEENVEKLLRDSAGMTKRAVEEYLVGLRAKPVSRPSIRKLPSRPEKGEETTGMTRREGEAECQAEPPSGGRPSQAGGGEAMRVRRTRRDAKRNIALQCPVTSPGAPRGSEPVPALETSPRPPSAPPGRIEPARPEVYNFRFAAGKSFKEKLLRVAEVLGMENPERSMAEILEKGLDLLLEKKAPERKRARRLGGGRNGTTRENRPGEIQDRRGTGMPSPPPSHATSRRGARARPRASELPLRVRGPDGTRCDADRADPAHKPFASSDHDERFPRASAPGTIASAPARVYGAGSSAEDRGRRGDGAPVAGAVQVR